LINKLEKARKYSARSNERLVAAAVPGTKLYIKKTSCVLVGSTSCCSVGTANDEIRWASLGTVVVTTVRTSTVRLTYIDSDGCRAYNLVRLLSYCISTTSTVDIHRRHSSTKSTVGRASVYAASTSIGLARVTESTGGS
jgi:hypothetical protein